MSYFPPRHPTWERCAPEAASLDPAAIALYQTRTHGLFGVGIDAVSALDCWGGCAVY